MHLSQMQQWLAQRRDQGLYRQEQLLQPLPGGLLGFNGQTLLNFSGNDYLGLASAPTLRQAFADAAHNVGSAATGSPLVTGFQRAHAELSRVLCDWLGVEAVLLFSSGFAANQAMLSALVAPDELLLLDKYCHASMQDVLMQGQLRFKRYPHQDFQALRQLLAKAQDKAVVVATEGVFSMDGDITDSRALLSLLSPEQPLLLDDAHGIGVLGEEGRGSWQQQGVTAQQLQCLMANFGKALAGQGGFLAGSRDVIDYIRQQSRHYIYSTALSPALCQAMVHSIELCRREQWRRDKMAENIALFRSGAVTAGLQLTDSVTAIQPLLCRDNATAILWSQALKKAGIWLTAIRPPTVPQARLRICLSAAHSPAQITNLISALVKARPVDSDSN
ncbi:MAG: 8-amino-7-oxononanoate synthase [Rheinheimera sp.]|nr:MAG: 8-amino-7-oxononanoate synthase [Rheinheimera sp.]